MPLSPPIRNDGKVKGSAVAAKSAVNRNGTQQVSHRARTEREHETSSGVSASDISRVLACDASYDDLNAHEQTVVRAEWAERTDQRRLSLDLADRFQTARQSYAECDSDGNVMRRDP